MEQPRFSAKIGPPDKVAALTEQPNQSYVFVVRIRDGQEILPERFGIEERVTPLEVINGFAAKMRVAQAFRLAEVDNVAQVWYLHPDLASLYVNTLKALQYNLITLPLPNLVNLSIGPQPRFWFRQSDVDSPMQHATRVAAAQGLIPLVAIGNSNTADQSAVGWINPWSYPKWVISVGAWDASTGSVADFSSRGDPAHSDTWPDVVADGVDVIGPFPTNIEKSPQRKEKDESNLRFRQRVPETQWDEFTLESGTSQATAVASAGAAQVLHFLTRIIEEHQPAPGKAFFSLTAAADRISEYDRQVPRLTGRAVSQADGSVVYEYSLDAPWKMVKQLLIDTAVPVPGAAPNEVGAGLVDIDYIKEQFGQFGVVQPKYFPTKVL